MEKTRNETIHEANVKRCDDFYAIARRNRHRLCKVGDEKGLFHRWTEERQVIEPSPMQGGHRGGEIACTLGIVELETGEVRKYYPQHIKFLDTADYWPE